MVDGSSDYEIYDDIFEACRHFAPSTILLTLDAEEFQPFKSANSYHLIGMQNGSAVALSNPVVNTLYRGENDVYEHCEASIYRNNKNEAGYDVIAIAIDEIRCIEFKNIIMTFPQIQASIADGIKPDFMALAQHYELNTPMVDFSSEPEIAAYFATHRWNNGTMQPIYDGIGCIRGYSAMGFMNDIIMNKPSKLHLFGMQCFMRPGLQHAYGLETCQGEDLAKIGWKVYFRQTKRASDNIHANFYFNEKTKKIDDKSWLFPDEEVVKIANLVKNSDTLSKLSLREYCTEHDIQVETMIEKMKYRGVSISDEPVFALSEEKKKELIMQYKDAPYGDVKLFSRLSCRPIK